MRLIVAIVVLAAGVVAGGCGGSDSGAIPGDCSSAVDWGGQRYYGDGAPGYPAAGRPVTPKAEHFTCDPKDATPYAARAMVGVPPAFGLRLDQEPQLVYLPRGFFTTLPGHPLHKALWHASDKPYRRGDGKRCQVRGRVGSLSTENFTLRTAASPELHVVVDARTRIGGPTRAGQPYLRAGEAVTVAARRCAIGADSSRVTAVRITPDRR